MDKATFIEGTAVGAVAGVIVGLLPARRFGQETRDEVKADLVELRDKTVARLQTLEHLTQQKCEEVVTAVISGYSAAERLTATRRRSVRPSCAVVTRHPADGHEHMPLDIGIA